MIEREDAERLRDTLLGVLAEDAHNTEAILARLDAISAETGVGAHAAAVLILTHLAFEDEDARRHWDLILAHRRKMSEALRREVGIRVAVLDYFVNVNRRLSHPVLIELEMADSGRKDYPVDPVTGLAEDRAFRTAVQAETRRAKRYGQKVCVVLFDLDDFAGVNATAGRLVADRLFKETAMLLHNKVRDIDVAARTGEDELAVVLPETDRTGALLVAERFRREVEAHFARRQVAGKPAGLTVSAGIACYPEDAVTPETLLEHAARALYQAKASGKNRVHVFHPERRRYLRVDFEAGRFEVEVLAPRLLDAGRARVFGRNGIVFASPEPLDIGEEIEIRLVSSATDPASRSPRIRGRVVRLEELPEPDVQEASASVPIDRFEIGMAFDVDITPADQDLVEFLESARSGRVDARP